MDKSKARKLPIRARRILDGAGETTMTRSVLCPTHGEAVALVACAECERCERIEGDAVTCRPTEVHPTMRWAPLLHRILPSAADRVAITEVMTRDVACVTADVSLEALTSLLLDRGIGAVPVVDSAGYPIGMVSKTDLVRERFENGDTGQLSTEEDLAGMHIAPLLRGTVGELMMPVAFTLREDDPLSRAAAVMSAEKVHHLPVVAADGRVVGILSSLDFVRWVAGQSAYADQI